MRQSFILLASLITACGSYEPGRPPPAYYGPDGGGVGPAPVSSLGTSAGGTGAVGASSGTTPVSTTTGASVDAGARADARSGVDLNTSGGTGGNPGGGTSAGVPGYGTGPILQGNGTGAGGQGGAAASQGSGSPGAPGGNTSSGGVGGELGGALPGTPNTFNCGTILCTRAQFCLVQSCVVPSCVPPVECRLIPSGCNSCTCIAPFADCICQAVVGGGYVVSCP